MKQKFLRDQETEFGDSIWDYEAVGLLSKNAKQLMVFEERQIGGVSNLIFNIDRNHSCHVYKGEFEGPLDDISMALFGEDIDIEYATWINHESIEVIKRLHKRYLLNYSSDKSKNEWLIGIYGIYPANSADDNVANLHYRRLRYEGSDLIKRMIDDGHLRG